jgi:aspartate racemase
MGPYAGLDLFEKVLDHTEARTDQDHLPTLVASFPHRIPNRSAFLNGEVDLNPAEPILDLLGRLEEAGAAVAGIPCVTAHAPQIIDVVRSRLHTEGRRIRLLHIAEETVRFIRETYPAIRAVAALSTTATFRRRILLDPIEAAGFEVVEQDMEVQTTLVEPAIFDPEFGIKAYSKPVTEAARDLVLRAVARLEEQGARAVVLGCTELPLAVPETHLGDTVFIDPTTVLARALIRECAPARLRPWAGR